jgi:hypothetical protein
VRRLAAIAALCFVAALQLHRLDDPDTWWHLASGRRIAERAQVDRVDPFSYTAPGAEWINRQWLFDLTAYESWRLAGEAGLTLLAGAGYLAGFLCLYVLARRRLPGWAAASLVVLAAQAGVERFTVRPEAATVAFLGVYLLVLDGPWRPRRVAALVALQVLWANLHALSVLGLIPLATAWVAAAVARIAPLPAAWRAQVERDPAELRALGVGLAAAAAAEAATPFGLRGALFPLRLLTVIRGGEVTSSAIVEHLPPTLATLSPVAAFGMIALLALGVAAIVVAWRDPRLDHLLLAIAFTVLAFLARRNVALVGFGVVPLASSGLGGPARAFDAWLQRRWPLALAAELALVVAIAVPTVRMVTGDWYRTTAHLTRSFGLGRSEFLFSRGATDWLDRHVPDARVFNDDELGGWLLWRSFPRRRVFLDGRLQVYPPDVFEEFMSVLNDPGAFAALASRRGITAAILHHPAPGRLELASAIARLPGWRVGYLDAGSIVLVADGQPPGVPDGVHAPVVETDADGVAGAIDGALGAVRTPVEAALGHYQRGRALAYLYGASGATLAADDFRAALRLYPGYAPAAAGLRAVGAS